jgi:hypothetical protein
MRLAVLLIAMLPAAAAAEGTSGQGLAGGFRLTGGSVWDTGGQGSPAAQAERARLVALGDAAYATPSDRERPERPAVETGRSLDRGAGMASLAPRPAAPPPRAAAPARAAAAPRPDRARTRGLGPWQTGIYQ